MTDVAGEFDPRAWVKVLTDLRALIASGAIAPRDHAPTINELHAKYGCARPTAAKALRELAKEGSVTMIPGLGYYVASRSRSDD